MPLIKQDALPISRDDLDALRLKLSRPHDFELVVLEDQRFLFLRSPRAEPDPVADLEECLEHVPDWAAHDLQDVFLLGDVGSFHVPGSMTHTVLQRRNRIDAQFVEELRAGLDAHYGLGLHRIHADPANLVRLGVRVPRARTSDLSEADLVRLARAAGPLLDSREADQVRLAYLIADHDHVRLTGRDFFADMEPRWNVLQKEELAKNAPPPAPDPPKAAAPRRIRPRRVLNVKPLVELETHLDAVPDDEHATRQLAAAKTTLDELLQVRGYDVLRNVQHGDTPFALAAERSVGYPRRVLVKTQTRFQRDDADRLLRQSRDLGADLLLVVAAWADDDARRRTIASKVKVIRPDEVPAFSL